VIILTYTAINSRTMVIIYINTFLAYITMLRSGRFLNSAINTYIKNTILNEQIQ